MNKEKPKIFLSYAREDMGMAKQLYNDLKRYGLDVWLDTKSLLPGDRWKDKIEDAIENSNYFIALLSTRSVNKKGFVQRELKTALEVLDLFQSSERFILPVRIDDCGVNERRLKELNWVDLFPKREYKRGLNKILIAINPSVKFLRSKPIKLDQNEVMNFIKKYDFFDKNLNPKGKGLNHQYKITKTSDDAIIAFDEETGLIWQQSGSTEEMIFEDTNHWIKKINRKRFAGLNDWRLPTLEEAMSLMDPNGSHIYISSFFNSKQFHIWTADQVQGESRAWIVDFKSGFCNKYVLGSSGLCFGRAVRSGQLPTE